MKPAGVLLDCGRSSSQALEELLEEGAEDEEEEEEGEGEGLQPGVLAAAHQALLQGVGPSGFQAYRRPPWFPVRVAFLLLFICLSLTAMSFFLLTVPGQRGSLAGVKGYTRTVLFWRPGWALRAELKTKIFHRL